MINLIDNTDICHFLYKLNTQKLNIYFLLKRFIKLKQVKKSIFFS